MTTKEVAENSKSATLIDETDFKKTVVESSETLKFSENKDRPIQWVIVSQQQDYLKLKEVMQKFEDEPELKQIMQDDREFGPVYSDLLATGGQNTQHLLSSFNWIDKLKVCLMYSRQDDRILDDMEHSLRKKRRTHMAQYNPDKTEKDFYHCIENNDQIGILDLLQKNQCFDKHKLRELCKTFGRKHPLLKLVCMKICEFIKRENPSLSDIWLAYKMIKEEEKVDETNIFFYLEMEGTEQKKLENIDVLRITRKPPNAENQVVIDYSHDHKIRLTGKDISQIGEEINKEISLLSEQHRNLAMIVPSPIKSIGYNTNKHQMISGKYIALFVPAKGIIPLQEDCFPKKLGEFETDVREGYCEWAAGGGPHEFHDTLKIGCAIASLGRDLYGTLGGFLYHKRHGLCALTSDHVFSKSSQKCVQPQGGRRNIFGKKVLYRFDGEKGVDAALIKIDKRHPSGGKFPDCSPEEMKLAGILNASNFAYTSGKIESIDVSTFDTCKDRIIMKYGAKTTFRRGELAAFNSTVPKPVEFSEKQRILFRHQIVISSITNYGTFAEKGDSGSLVYMLTDEGLVAIGIIMAVTDIGYTIVNPIDTVLKEFGCTSLISFPDSTSFDEGVDIVAENENEITDTLNVFSSNWTLANFFQQNEIKLNEDHE